MWKFTRLRILFLLACALFLPPSWWWILSILRSTQQWEQQDSGCVEITSSISNVDMRHVNVSHPLIKSCSTVASKPEHLAHIEKKNDNRMTPFDMSLHDPSREVISMSIVKDTCYECPILYSLVNAMHDTSAKHLLDVGGNIGLYALHVAANGFDVTTFEPFKTNQERICQTINENTGLFAHKVTLVAAALTNTTGIVSFNTKGFKNAVYKRGRNQLNLGSLVITNSVKMDNEHQQGGEEGKDYAQGVMMNNLKEILPPRGAHVALKVDVEGSECNALLGALEYLSMLVIDYVAIEMSYSRLQICEANGQLQPIFDLFIKNDLNCFIYNTETKGWTGVNASEWRITWKGRGLFDLAWSKTLPRE